MIHVKQCPSHRKPLVGLRIASHLLQAPHVQSFVKYPHNPDRKPSTTPIKNCPTTTNPVFQWFPTVRQTEEVPFFEAPVSLPKFRDQCQDIGTILIPMSIQPWSQMVEMKQLQILLSVTRAHSLDTLLFPIYHHDISCYVCIPYSIQIFIHKLEKYHCSLGFPNKSYQKQQCQDHESHAASTKSSHLEFRGAFCQVMAA